jgi:hypothetical protein
MPKSECCVVCIVQDWHRVDSLWPCVQCVGISTWLRVVGLGYEMTDSQRARTQLLYSSRVLFIKTRGYICMSLTADTPIHSDDDSASKQCVSLPPRCGWWPRMSPSGTSYKTLCSGPYVFKGLAVACHLQERTHCHRFTRPSNYTCKLPTNQIKLSQFNMF